MCVLAPCKEALWMGQRARVSRSHCNTHCNTLTLQHTLQHAALPTMEKSSVDGSKRMCCAQHTATRCTIHHGRKLCWCVKWRVFHAQHCNTLQHIATRCTTNQGRKLYWCVPGCVFHAQHYYTGCVSRATLLHTATSSPPTMKGSSVGASRGVCFAHHTATHCKKQTAKHTTLHYPPWTGTLSRHRRACFAHHTATHSPKKKGRYCTTHHGRKLYGCVKVLHAPHCNTPPKTKQCNTERHCTTHHRGKLCGCVKGRVFDAAVGCMCVFASLRRIERPVVARLGRLFTTSNEISYVTLCNAPCHTMHTLNTGFIQRYTM